ncbi:hypothetical protein DFQ27_000760 [Actinomortierella ambigua]|uniref:Extracellular membrane protein CFEM domain-containing protein n=1 Tax=Actinomortierella ambigua TaxID=1343610 RepID=A0A9P6QFQ4_9FUNG|nr:hypothetical protein DFQ27_000760 [Actinomortierella ambigua]
MIFNCHKTLFAFAAAVSISVMAPLILASPAPAWALHKRETCKKDAATACASTSKGIIAGCKYADCICPEAIKLAKCYIDNFCDKGSELEDAYKNDTSTYNLKQASIAIPQAAHLH